MKNLRKKMNLRKPIKEKSFDAKKENCFIFLCFFVLIPTISSQLFNPKRNSDYSKFMYMLNM